MLTTARLLITPLTYPQLVTYLQADNALEAQIGLAKEQRVVDQGFREMMEKFALPSMNTTSPANHIFFTCWIVVDKASNRIVAELGFKGPPNAQGEIEIGYDTLEGHQRKGYMTEAVGALIDWAGTQSQVRAVLAETEHSNLASIRVVQKNGFKQFDQKGTMLWWRKALDQGSGSIQAVAGFQ